MLNYLFTNTPLLFFIQSLWRDEAFSYLLAKKGLVNLLVATAKDFNPPLYYLALHFWMKIFGTSEIALRSLSLFFYWATIYIVFLFLTEILKINFKKSLFYLLFFILNPLLLYYAFEGRMYTMLAFFATLSFYSLYKKNLSLFFLSSILGLYAHYFMIFVILGQFSYYFPVQYYLYHGRRQDGIKKFLKMSLFPLGFFLPWVFFVFFQKGNLLQSFWIEKMTLRSLTSFLGIIYTGYEPALKFFDKSILKLSAAFIFLVIIGFLKIRQEKLVQKKLFYYLLLWGVGIPLIVGVIFFVKPLFLPRYLIFAAVGFLLLLIFILERLPVFLRSAILLVFFVITINYHRLQIKERKKADLRQTIGQIKSLAKNDDVLYVTDELNFHTAQYYFDENRVYIYGKTYQEIPNYVGKVLIPKERVINKLPLYPKKAFILSSSDHYEIQAAF